MDEIEVMVNTLPVKGGPAPVKMSNLRMIAGAELLLQTNAA